MRTTVTLDEHHALGLKQVIRRTGATFKETFNNVISDGLAARRKPVKQKPFVVKPLNLGLPPGLSSDSIPPLLEAIKGSYHR